MKQNNNRSSNFELLRIVAMIMIIMHHLFIHCIGKQLIDIESIANMNNGYFNNPTVYNKLFIADYAYFMGPLGNAFFILISGYFMSEKENIDMKNISIKLLSQLVFASICLIFVSFIWSMISTGRFTGVADISYFNSLAWYIGYYFLIILTGKLFLNNYLAKLNKTQYIEFLFIIFSLIEFTWTGTFLDNLIPGLRLLCTGIFLYSIGGYIKKYNPFNKIKISVIILYIVLVICVIYFSAYNIRVINIEEFINSGEKEYIQVIPRFDNWDFLVLTASVMIFELFRRMKPFHNKIINFLGGATLMIYIIHDNPFFYALWMRVDWIYYWYNNTFQFLLNVLLWVAITFSIGLIVYVAYVITNKMLAKTINNNQ